VNTTIEKVPSAALRTSPLHDALASTTSQWTVINRMRIAAHIGTAAEENKKLQSIALTDLSHLQRCGLKGSGAEAWLKSIGITTPAGINQWASLGECGLIARLASSEFLIENNAGQDDVDRVRTELGRGVAGVTPVLRQDAEIALAGPRVNELLLQTCSFNFASLDLAAHPIVMTSMIGVSVLLLPGTWRGHPLYQIWCDGTYGTYLWQHLLEIAEELDGGAVGIAALFSDTKLEP
jgi:sarcosine oxidase, subunit gamma